MGPSEPQLRAGMTRHFATAVVLWGAVALSASAAEMQSTSAQPSTQRSSAVRESFERMIAAVLTVLPAVVVLVVFWGLATLARRIVPAAAQYIHDLPAKMLVTQVSYYLGGQSASSSRSTPSA